MLVGHIMLLLYTLCGGILQLFTHVCRYMDRNNVHIHDIPQNPKWLNAALFILAKLRSHARLCWLAQKAGPRSTSVGKHTLRCHGNRNNGG